MTSHYEYNPIIESAIVYKLCKIDKKIKDIFIGSGISLNDIEQIIRTDVENGQTLTIIQTFINSSVKMVTGLNGTLKLSVNTKILTDTN